MKILLAPFLILYMSLTISACGPNGFDSGSDSHQGADRSPPSYKIPTFSPIFSDNKIAFVSNHEINVLPFQTDLTATTQIDIPLAGKPVWIAGLPFENGSAWAVTLEDGSTQAFLVNEAGYTPLAISPKSYSPEMPLTIYSMEGQLFGLSAPGQDGSPYSAPILIDGPIPKIIYIAINGDLVIWSDGQGTRLPVDALPDSQILYDGQDKLLFLSKPTDRYGHAVLGDGLEAAGITLVDISAAPKILNTISIPEPDVIEGIYPIWSDIDADGEREIIVTLSNVREGARIAVFREDGSLLAEGPAIGTGFRWRHQLLVAPFGNSQENLLAVVRTPHIGGVVEFYRLIGDKLEIVSEVSGISTHTIGSRNLYTALAGDFDSDGQIELLAPDQAQKRLMLVGLEPEAQVMFDLNAELSTNLAMLSLPDLDEVIIAAGLSNNILRVWLP
ncbi:MAG: hypothetical protein QGD88_12150 [Anaerolineae bacterium]|nr:hypothetical protein [Anaerolineae bacterium]